MWETTCARNSHAGLGRPFYERNILTGMQSFRKAPTPNPAWLFLANVVSHMDGHLHTTDAMSARIGTSSLTRLGTSSLTRLGAIWIIILRFRQTHHHDIILL